MPRKKREIPWLDWRDGTAYACWYDAKASRTRRISLRTSDAGQAQSRFAAFLQLGGEVTGQAATGGFSVAKALDDYEREHVEKHVVDQDRAKLAIRHIKAFFGALSIESIDIPACRAYADARRAGRIGRPAVDATIRRELSGALVPALSHAEKWKRIPRGSAPFIELPPDSLSRERWLTLSELGRLRLAAGEDTRARRFIEMAYYTASRREAVERLTVFQVSLDGGYINLAKPGERKTKKRRPKVAIHPRLLPWMQKMHAEALVTMQKDATLRAEGEEGIPGAECLLVGGTSVYKQVKDAIERAGLGRWVEDPAFKGGCRWESDVMPHTLRHTRASHLLQAGENVWEVAKLLGDTVATVDRVYGHHAMGVRSPAERAALLAGTELIAA